VIPDYPRRIMAVFPNPHTVVYVDWEHPLELHLEQCKELAELISRDMQCTWGSNRLIIQEANSFYRRRNNSVAIRLDSAWAAQWGDYKWYYGEYTSTSGISETSLELIVYEDFISRLAEEYPDYYGYLVPTPPAPSISRSWIPVANGDNEREKKERKNEIRY